jgi:L-arabinokinase
VCARHPVYENFRVQQFALLLQQVTINNPHRPEILNQLGELMYQSHASYSACGLGHPCTDELVNLVKQQPEAGVYGAKITGGGSGGTVCVLLDGELGRQTTEKLYARYTRRYKVHPSFIFT